MMTVYLFVSYLNIYRYKTKKVECITAFHFFVTISFEGRGFKYMNSFVMMLV